RPTLSADGKKIFVQGEDERGELVAYNKELHEFVSLLGGISGTWVTYSRSAKNVAYISVPDLTVWRANSNGSEKKQITFAPLEADGLAWSPDERLLAIRARTPGKNWQIYLVPAEGGQPRQLVGDAEEKGVPSWSPDSNYIVFGEVSPHFGKPQEYQKI